MLNNNNNTFNTIPLVMQRTREADDGVRCETARQ